MLQSTQSRASPSGPNVVSRLHARLEKLQKNLHLSPNPTPAADTLLRSPVSIPQNRSREGLYHISNLSLAKGRQKPESRKRGPHDISLLCNQPLPNIRNGPSLGNVVRHSRQGNRTNALIELPNDPGIKLGGILRKQKTSKDLRRPMRPDKCFQALMRCQHQGAVEWYHSNRDAIPPLHAEEPGNETERVQRPQLKPARESLVQLFEPLHFPQAEAIHKRKIVVRRRANRQLGLPNEDSYQLMVGLFRDIKRMVQEPVAVDSELGTLSAKLGLDIGEEDEIGAGSWKRKSTAETGATAGTQELSDELKNMGTPPQHQKSSSRPVNPRPDSAAEDSEEIAEEVAPLDVPVLPSSTRFLARPLTDEGARGPGTSVSSPVHKKGIREIRDFPQTVSEEGETPARAKEFVLPQNKAPTLDDIVDEMKRDMGGMPENVALTPSLASGNAHVELVHLAVHDVWFLEPDVIPENLYCYGK